MKNRILLIAIIFLVFVSSCGKNTVDIDITPTLIAFVHYNGISISNGECIISSEGYAIEIKTEPEGIGEYIPIEINYIVNGLLYSMSFERDGSQIIPITLKEGLNTAHIVGSELKSEIYYVAQDDFVLVE